MSSAVWQARCQGEDLRFWGAVAPAEQGEKAATCEYMCPGKFTKWRTESWPLSQAAWPMGCTN